MYKVLGQSVPSPNVSVDLYTVPIGFNCFITRLSICNQNPSTPSSVRLSIRVNGEASNSKQFILFDYPVDMNDTYNESISGIGLSAGDVVSIMSNVGNVSFNLFGQEVGV